MAVTEYVIRIPEESNELIYYWAKSVGWQPTVTNDAGELVANPMIAIAACFGSALQSGSSAAVHQMSMEAAEEARVTAITKSGQMMQAILQETTFTATTDVAPVAAPRGLKPGEVWTPPAPLLAPTITPKAKR